jgi:hypothetical protein
MNEQFLRGNQNDGPAFEERNSDFQRKLYEVLIYSKRYSLIDLSRELGKAPNTIYYYAEGKLRLGVGEASRMVEAISRTDKALAAELLMVLVPAGLRVIQEPTKKSASRSADFLEHLLGLYRGVGQIDAEAKAALHDLRFDDAEKRKLLRICETLITRIREFMAQAEESYR